MDQACGRQGAGVEGLRWGTEGDSIPVPGLSVT